jgi:hypothetical protein
VPPVCFNVGMPSPQSDAVIRGGREFATTQWSIVIAAKGDATEARGALA